MKKYKNILSYIFCIILGGIFIYYWGIENVYARVVLIGNMLWLLVKNWKNRFICFSSSITYFSLFSYLFVSENYFFGYKEPVIFWEKFIPFGSEIPFVFSIIGYLFVIVILNAICYSDDD